MANMDFNSMSPQQLQAMNDQMDATMAKAVGAGDFRIMFRHMLPNTLGPIIVNGTLAVEGGESRVWAVRDKYDPDKIATAPIPPEVIARFG